MSLRGKAAVTGVGETAYALRSDKTSFELQIEASLKEIDDAGLSTREIGGIITAAPAEDFVTNFGIVDLRFSAANGYALPTFVHAGSGDGEPHAAAGRRQGAAP